MNGISRADFEFGELNKEIETILAEIKAPTMMISHEKFTELQQILMRIRALIRRWIGFENIIGSIDSISGIIEELIATRSPVIRVENDVKQRMMELYNGMQVDIRKAYEHT